MDDTEGTHGLVVLIHGLARTQASMRLLSMRLQRAGFRTAFARYDSRRMRLNEAVDAVAQQMEQVASGQPLHLVGHSLGGVVSLRVKHERPDLAVHRVVQLGSPNRGSAAARTLSEMRLAREFFGPVLAELSGDMSIEHDPDPDVMAIAGASMPRWLSQRYGIHGTNDGLVSVRSAWGWAAGKRLRVESIHGWLPLSAEIAQDVVTFLKSGEAPTHPDVLTVHADDE